jgi:hypothetical protein
MLNIADQLPASGNPEMALVPRILWLRHASKRAARATAGSMVTYLPAGNLPTVFVTLRSSCYRQTSARN